MYTELQQAVIDLAQEVLRKDHNVNKVCLDQLQSDEDIERAGVDECAAALIIDTCYWEGCF